MYTVLLNNLSIDAQGRLLRQVADFEDISS